MNLILLAIEAIVISTIWYLYLHKKTRISLKYLYIDNLAVILPIIGLIIFTVDTVPVWLMVIINGSLVFGLSFTYTMIRFWRTPNRKNKAKEGQIVSPADGNVIYIQKVAKGQVPVSIKKGLEAKIEEITQTDLLNQGGWLIGINMTPFDVHKNCAPINGEIILNKHINGEFLSLKEPKAILRNERNTLVIKTAKNEFFGIVQTSSKLVKRIDSYVKVGQKLKAGDWFGMIRFGSQVDIIIPSEYKINVEYGQQLYAGESVIANK